MKTPDKSYSVLWMHLSYIIDSFRSQNVVSSCWKMIFFLFSCSGPNGCHVFFIKKYKTFDNLNKIRSSMYTKLELRHESILCKSCIKFDVQKHSWCNNLTKQQYINYTATVSQLKIEKNMDVVAHCYFGLHVLLNRIEISRISNPFSARTVFKLQNLTSEYG